MDLIVRDTLDHREKFCVDSFILLPMRDHVPRLAQRIAHQCLIVAPDEREIVFSTEQRIAPPTQQRASFVDAADAVDVGNVFEDLHTLRVAEYRELRVREKFGDGTDGRRGEQRIADAGDVDDQHAFGLAGLFCSDCAHDRACFRNTASILSSITSTPKFSHANR